MTTNIIGVSASARYEAAIQSVAAALRNAGEAQRILDAKGALKAETSAGQLAWATVNLARAVIYLLGGEFIEEEAADGGTGGERGDGSVAGEGDAEARG